MADSAFVFGEGMGGDAARAPQPEFGLLMDTGVVGLALGVSGSARGRVVVCEAPPGLWGPEDAYRSDADSTMVEQVRRFVACLMLLTLYFRASWVRGLGGEWGGVGWGGVGCGRGWTIVAQIVHGLTHTPSRDSLSG